jgi:hypothetical protein
LELVSVEKFDCSTVEWLVMDTRPKCRYVFVEKGSASVSSLGVLESDLLKCPALQDSFEENFLL